MSFEFIITSLIVVLIPGTGVIYTISIAITNGRKAGIWAAIGCTLGIVPHLFVSVLGLSYIHHFSAQLFQIIRFAGVLYLLYLAWNLWKDSGSFEIETGSAPRKAFAIIIKTVLINLLNPKLTLFFFSFLPQFSARAEIQKTYSMLILSGVFMVITLIVFLIYGFLAGKAGKFLNRSNKAVQYTKKSFSALLTLCALKLALSRE